MKKREPEREREKIKKGETQREPFPKTCDSERKDTTETKWRAGKRNRTMKRWRRRARERRISMF